MEAEKTVIKDDMTLEEARREAVIGGKKITHRWFSDNEYLHYEDGKWKTEEGYIVPSSYWDNVKNNWGEGGWSIYDKK